MKYSIEVWIYNPIAKEILLLKVKTEQLSFWQPITGGIENGESSEIACIREIFEETGLEIELTKLLQVGHYTVVIDEDLTIFKTLFLVETKQKDIRISDEHIDFMWTEVKKVPDILYWQSNQETFQKILEKLR
ncbi:MULTISPECIES: NUDIX hydrolase [Streptococcus]|uniref:NUDIX domain-containing protein n=2 Tax=Streptococcus TaxID=1301 RepID=A0A6G4MVZ5_STRAP|nr:MULTISPECIES: NUDIX domain-containing protein [Streptococcus]KAA9294439.1 NUDIX domain-containing protein [Streptococcus anginosus]MBO0364082.1 NUDIX domain-containing protein [Streptococcus vaginalis]MBU5588419.1 NUDIX domain-containing protein [Streptococcus anginosus]MCW0949118.1 NUDIX domain-containing protein [Streptococcus anginosus]MCW0963114.1 NUDIX domain-containing protein [Streptococcus anginosus]